MNEAGTAMSHSQQPDAATVIRQWFEEVWNQGQEDAIDRLFPEHATMWGVGRPELASKGSGQFKEFYRQIRSAFPDTKIVLHQVVQEGDTAFARWTVTATHSGHGLGVAPTHQQLKIVGMSACRVQDGVIVEGWNLWDQIGMARQLGMLQGPAATLFP
jgi:steroid delta-isomerase-like uncharacterized protein